MTVTVEQIKHEASILNAKVQVAQAAETIQNQFSVLAGAMKRLHELEPSEHHCSYSVSLSTPDYPPSSPMAAQQEVLS